LLPRRKITMAWPPEGGALLTKLMLRTVTPFALLLPMVKAADGLEIVT
jgi:hypothetical protein